MNKLMLSLAPIALLGCGVPEPDEKTLQCQAAKTNREAFGRPGNLGPCVGYVHNQNQTANQFLLGFDHQVTGDYYLVHWHRGEIISIGFGRL